MLLALALLACSQHKEPTATAPAPAAALPPAAPSTPAPPPLDATLIADRLGATPRALPGGALSVTLPRSGVTVSVEEAPSPDALTTELTFRPAAESAALTGSVDVLEDEVSPVIDTLLAHGIRLVGLYNRALYDDPRVLVLRFEGQGNPALLASGAQSISSVLRDARLRSNKPLKGLPGEAPQPGKLDAAALGGVLGVTATEKDGVVWIDVPRSTGGAPLLHASFSGSDLRAVLSGTFVLSARELGPVLTALRTANVHLVGLVPQDGDGDGGSYSLHVRGKNTSLGLVRGLAQAIGAVTATP